MDNSKSKIALFLLRVTLGFYMLWAFFDKLFGLGKATPKSNAWLSGGSPTTDFLKLYSSGPFKEFYASLAGQAWVDWLFMLGLLLIGLALILGVGIRIACYSGSLLFLLMWTALLWPKNNPFLDDHIIFIVALAVIQFTHAGRYYGLGNWWSKTNLVKWLPVLE